MTENNNSDVVETMALLGSTTFAFLYIIGLAPFQDAIVIMLSQIAVLIILNGR